MAKNLAFGSRYVRDPGQTAEEFIGLLAEFVEGRLGGLPLFLELASGTTVVGRIDGITPAAVILESNDGSLVATFASEEISAFELIDIPLDRSDELRGAEW